MSDMTSNLGHYVAKPLCSAAVAGVATRLAYGGAPEFPVFGVDKPWWMVMAGAAFLGSVVGELVHEKAFPLVGPTNRLSAPISSAVTVATSAGTCALVLGAANAQAMGDVGLPQLLGISAVAEVAGDYLYTHFVSPMVLDQQA